MKKSSNNQKYKAEIKKIVDELEKMLKESKDEISGSELSQVYTLIHTLNETSQAYGIESIPNLFAPIEKELAVRLEAQKGISTSDVAVLLSSAGFSNTILDDPTLSNSGLKTNYEALHKQIEETFSKDEPSLDDTFSNSRFQDIFLEEANDLINQLEEKLLQLETEPEDTGLVDNVFRIMHTLKGNSNMFGHKHLGEITHHLENIYDEIRSSKLEINRNILDITLQCIDHFRNLIEDAELSDPTNKVIQESILNDISEILSTEPQNGSDIELTSEEKTDSNLKTYYIFFHPKPNIFDDGSNPLYFVYDLYELGNCSVVPVSTDIPNDESYDPEKSYICWHILLATKESSDTISDNFIFLSEDNQPVISTVSDDDRLQDKDFIDTFKIKAQSTVSISEKIGFVKSAQKPTPKKQAPSKKEAVAPVRAKNQDSSIASIRVASTKIDLMMNLISELVTKQAELSMIANENEIGQLQEVAESIESISRDLRDNAFSISLIPLEKSVLRFQRLVRDVSSRFNKHVNFIIEGKETELDKTIIEKIVDPIMHILRNSIDHGIESPEERIRLGKPEHGTITLKAYPSGAHVIMEISDDGSGINIEKVRKAAIRKGFIKESDPFTKEDMLKLILKPGFSTTENISEVSGRGVGMDVVNQKIMEIRGELDISTEANVGTTMTIKLPLTISIIDSLLVMIGETYYLIPLGVVERCAEVQTPVITENKNNYLNLDNQYIPFIDLHSEFNTTEERLDYQRLILVKHKDLHVALVVDQIMGNHQAVLKSLGQIYRKQEIISGASILGNGEVALVLDSNKLVQEYMLSRDEELTKLNLLNSQILEKNVN